MPLLPGGSVHLSQLGWFQTDQLWLDLLQEGFDLPLLALLHSSVRVRIQSVKVGLASACRKRVYITDRSLSYRSWGHRTGEVYKGKAIALINQSSLLLAKLVTSMTPDFHAILSFCIPVVLNITIEP